jgi:transcription elongation factor GreA-like protein
MIYIQEIQKIIQDLEADRRINKELIKYIREKYVKTLEDYIKKEKQGSPSTF